MADGVQDASAAITWSIDWSTHLAANGGLTITAATVTADSGAAVTSVSRTTTSVTFKLTTSGVTEPSNVVVTTTVTLSNGDTDVRHHTIQVTNT